MDASADAQEEFADMMYLIPKTAGQLRTARNEVKRLLATSRLARSCAPTGLLVSVYCKHMQFGRKDKADSERSESKVFHGRYRFLSALNCKPTVLAAALLSRPARLRRKGSCEGNGCSDYNEQQLDPRQKADLVKTYFSDAKCRSGGRR